MQQNTVATFNITTFYSKVLQQIVVIDLEFRIIALSIYLYFGPTDKIYLSSDFLSDF